MLLNFVNPSSKTRPAPAVAFAISAVLVVGASAGAYAVYRKAVGGPSSIELSRAERFVVVKSAPLDVTIVQQGELQAVDNIDLVSKVEGRATITDLVREGAYVKKDEVLIQLDSQTIRQGIDDTTLEVQRAEAAVSNAREMLAIQASNNNAELEGATVALQLAELDLKKYVEGTFPQEVKTAQTKLDMARVNLQTKQDELQQSKNLFTRGFAMANDVKKAELAVTEAKNGVQEAETALRVLQEYNHQADFAGKQNALAQAKSKLERVKRQNESLIVQKQADLTSAEQQLSLRTRKLEELKQQLEYCTIKAPADGMVVYVNNPDNQQAVIQEGAEVRERQPILRLPDVSAMKAVLKLNEAQANRVQVGMRANVEITGIQRPISGTVTKVSIVPVSGNRWMNPDSKEYPAEVTLDTTPPNLKPATSAKTTIMVKSLDDVFTVPLMAIYSAGYKSYVFVGDDAGGIAPREVQLGEASLTDVQVKSGLTAGERVLRLEAGEGKRLLEQSGIKVEPATQPTRGPNAVPGAIPGAPGERGPAGMGPNGGGPGAGSRQGMGGPGGAINGAPTDPTAGPGGAGGAPGGRGMNGERRRRSEGGGPGAGGPGAGGRGPAGGAGGTPPATPAQ